MSFSLRMRARAAQNCNIAYRIPLSGNGDCTVWNIKIRYANIQRQMTLANIWAEVLLCDHCEIKGWRSWRRKQRSWLAWFRKEICKLGGLTGGVDGETCPLCARLECSSFTF